MDLDISILQQVLQEEKVVAALRLLNTLDPSVERAPKDLQAAVATLAETLTGVEGVEEAAIKVTIMASRLYLFGMQLLPLLHGFSDPGWWAEAIPETSNKALRSWQAAPTSKSKMAKALAAMVSEKLETASGPSANDAAALSDEVRKIGGCQQQLRAGEDQKEEDQQGQEKEEVFEVVKQQL